MDKSIWLGHRRYELSQFCHLVSEDLEQITVFMDLVFLIYKKEESELREPQGVPLQLALKPTDNMGQVTYCDMPRRICYKLNPTQQDTSNSATIQSAWNIVWDKDWTLSWHIKLIKCNLIRTNHSILLCDAMEIEV